MTTQAKASPIAARGTSRKWLIPVVAGLLLIVIVAAVAIALSSGAKATPASAIEAGIEASSARWQALGKSYSASAARAIVADNPELALFRRWARDTASMSDLAHRAANPELLMLQHYEATMAPGDPSAARMAANPELLMFQHYQSQFGR
jgi:hypothetical protein